MPRHNQFWIVFLVSLVLAQVAASLLMPRGAALTITSDLIQGTLLLAATLMFLPKTAASPQTTRHTRLFWILMSTGMVFWLAYQGMWNYFEVILREEVPDPFIGDIVLFLHLVPMIAALAVLPHLRDSERDERIRMLDFALLLTWWVSVYVYLVIPWQTVQVDELAYSNNLNSAYLTEKLVFLVALAGLAYTSQGGWRQLYGQLLGASALYASSSYVANWAIGHKRYYSGSIYDVPLTVSMAWMAAVPIFAGRLDLSDWKPSKPLLGIWITRLSMIALFTLPGAALYADNDSSLPHPVQTFRIIASLGAMVVMGGMVFWRQKLLGLELSFFLDKSRRSVDELKALQEQLIQSEKLASLGQLVGGAAHEINNPLTAMLGYSDLLSASSLPGPEQQQALRIGEQVRRTKTLVASLLTFARPTPAKMTTVDLNSVLQTAVRLLAPQLETQNVTVRIELAPALPTVLADSNQVLHVCLHLAGQIGGHLDSAVHSALFVRTHADEKSVFVDFIADAPFAHVPAFRPLFGPGIEDTPATLSLNACGRIVKEHGGQLFRPEDRGYPAFRMELPVAGKAAHTQPGRSAVSGV